jgi:cytochrome bd-type quinol oxidase subunit 2
MQNILDIALAVTASLLVLTMQGSLWIAMRNRGGVESRALDVASISHWGVSAVALGIFIVSLNAPSGLVSALASQPILWIVPVLAASGLFGVRECLSMKLSGAAFVSSTVFVVGLLGSGAFGMAH